MPKTIAIRTRDEAKSIGRKLYFTGRPCQHGHVCERYVNRQWCVECARTGFKPDGTPNRYRSDDACENGHVGWRYMRGACIECHWERMRAFRAEARAERKAPRE